jgi:hypothetical protein
VRTSGGAVIARECTATVANAAESRCEIGSWRLKRPTAKRGIARLPNRDGKVALKRQAERRLNVVPCGLS